MLKVVTFNILCGVYNETPDHETSKENRAPRLKAVLAPLEADLIGLQEARPRWIPYLEEYFGEDYEIFYKERKVDNPESTPMMWKKSRFDCLDKGYFWLSDTPDVESGGWDTYGCHRIVCWAKLHDKQEDRDIVFLNTHYGFGDENQVKSSKLIMDHIKLWNLPAFVTADYNMYPASPGYVKLQEMLTNTNEAFGHDDRNTFHGFHSEPTGYGPIDFCFYTPEHFETVGYRRLDQLIDGKFPSDHFGVYSEMEYKNHD